MDRPFFTLLQGAEILAPQKLGRRDLLIAGNKIAAIGDHVHPPCGYDCEIVDLNGHILLPGFVDGHAHLIGGGGEGGYATRTPEAVLSKIVAAGVTTVVGCLGADAVTRHPANLLAKVRALESEGISAYLFTGAYQVPPPTLTGSIRGDLVLIDKVIGVGEIALSDHRSSQPALGDYRKIAAESRVGGLLSGKSGIVVVHLGDGKAMLQPLFELIETTELPITQFLPTHVNRGETLFAQSLDWLRRGGSIDLTACIRPVDDMPDSIKPSIAVRKVLENGAALDRVTLTSDAYGSMPEFDARGNTIGVNTAGQDALFEEVRDMIVLEHVPPSIAIATVTENPAKILKLWPDKGQIARFADADLVAVDRNYEIRKVWAKGRLMADGGQAVVRGTFE